MAMLFNVCMLMAMMVNSQPQEAKKPLAISFEQAQSLSNRIWKNECAGKIEGLTTWNEGEDFASLGIGHFLWYPSQRKQVFGETFPDVLLFIQSCGVPLPKWIEIEKGCPWRNKKHFQQHIDSPKMIELREFLYETRALQAIYIAKRLEEALPKLTAKLELTEKRRVEKHFNALAQTSKGMYALIDYLNFKGEGLNPSERYKERGWGLLQVLQRIPENSIRPLDDFVKAAKELLVERVANAPTGKNEKRWLPGWNARLNTYLQGS
jgi:hypothetical protein